MFIHIGNDNVIQSKDVISIIDRNIISSSTIMEEMIQRASKNESVVETPEETKSVVITKDLIYFSSLSVATLKKRASMISTLNKLDNYSDELE
ncbi:extracellular matrix regulator RemB [Virgibacillus necropolis]|uniref:DUF370 domain-containing protein n=1 Tax=Virgibacillus necropolis TaxID=163877 RepID=A0A221M824_9BACI|nr:extracellular matrix/biofilm biosynthesis regulator RemA family protein [Virgibacillus necropolis]ASN03788.1 DUF370 domain-containing protein [Virgibacillus necropolis]